MRLRGREKMVATWRQKEDRKYRGQKLGRVAETIEAYARAKPDDFEGGSAWEPWEIVAWHAGWMKNRKFLKADRVARILWPQENIYMIIFKQSPVLSLLSNKST